MCECVNRPRMWFLPFIHGGPIQVVESWDKVEWWPPSTYFFFHNWWIILTVLFCLPWWQHKEPNQWRTKRDWGATTLLDLCQPSGSICWCWTHHNIFKYMLTGLPYFLRYIVVQSSSNCLYDDLPSASTPVENSCLPPPALLLLQLASGDMLPTAALFSPHFTDLLPGAQLWSSGHEWWSLKWVVRLPVWFSRNRKDSPLWYVPWKL